MDRREACSWGRQIYNINGGLVTRSQFTRPGPWLGRVGDGRGRRKNGEAQGPEMPEGDRTSALGPTENNQKSAAPATPQQHPHRHSSAYSHDAVILQSFFLYPITRQLLYSSRSLLLPYGPPFSYQKTRPIVSPAPENGPIQTRSSPPDANRYPNSGRDPKEQARPAGSSEVGRGKHGYPRTTRRQPPPTITLGSELSELSSVTLSSETSDTPAEPEPGTATQSQPEHLDIPTLNNILQQREDQFLDRILTQLARKQSPPPHHDRAGVAERGRPTQPTTQTPFRSTQHTGDTISEVNSTYSPPPILSHDESASAAMNSVEAWFPRWILWQHKIVSMFCFFLYINMGVMFVSFFCFFTLGSCKRGSCLFVVSGGGAMRRQLLSDIG